jgi:hypothetical protein
MGTVLEQQRYDEFERLLSGTPSGAVLKDGAFTVKELVQATGRGPEWVRTSLRAAIAAGAWEVVRIHRKNMAGYMQTMPAYRPVAKKKKK